MELQSLKASTRTETGSAHARRLRRQGFVPAVLYGGDGEPVGLRLEARALNRLVHGRGGEHAVLQLEFEDNPALSGPAMVKEVQHHPVRGEITHADFLRISLEERIVTVVPVVLTGRAPGAAEGGILEHILREVEVECRALDVPDSLELDVSTLGIGESLRVSDLTAPANVTIVTDPERAVAAVHAPRVTAEEAAPEAEGEAAEPEVIGKKAEEEEGE